jgi:hypothetical protein
MGKRGPAPKGEYAGKSKVLSTRIRPDTREALSTAAAASGRSLSQEIEHRLRRSFLEDGKISDLFGTREAFSIFRLAALALERGWNPKNPEGDWRSDPVAFDHGVRLINAILEPIRPLGLTKTKAKRRNVSDKEMWARHDAATLWNEIQHAETNLPLSAGTRGQYLARILKTDLGEIGRRPKIFEGTADEMRRHAQELTEKERKVGQSQKGRRRK